MWYKPLLTALQPCQAWPARWGGAYFQLAGHLTALGHRALPDYARQEAEAKSPILGHFQLGMIPLHGRVGPCNTA